MTKGLCLAEAPAEVILDWGVGRESADELLSPEDVQAILEYMRQVPSDQNGRPWRFFRQGPCRAQGGRWRQRMQGDRVRRRESAVALFCAYQSLRGGCNVRQAGRCYR